MKKVSLIVFSAFILLSACISEQENFSVRLEQDKEAILKYIAENPLPGGKTFKDEPNGFYIFWEEAMNTTDSLRIGDTLYIDYTGKLLDNTVFDTSIDSIAQANNIKVQQREYKPLQFIVGRDRLIEGFMFALSKMQEGDKATTIFPSLYGYGPSASGRIPANSPLIFDIHLKEVRRNTLND
ncbi:FKBP-type peptidyl-prolyl cis-trans isomerase [Belliella sp. DSM 107340]|uniref:Peptidyl-prolyl cis-trans isomerase n=1 Tax=Belliella calami TaxID=2923436 RepID=A0ABS9UL94_9BACT|nr:FKBP-type peptidyl-prolyl cis-trans isomerase [Belliella calami]MCH7397399.1 FKBP-type peptidyl-prolyl cis-trans isomerase [Belliella calami]